jgi:hypothetical protein
MEQPNFSLADMAAVMKNSGVDANNWMNNPLN